MTQKQLISFQNVNIFLKRTNMWKVEKKVYFVLKICLLSIFSCDQESNVFDFILSVLADVKKDSIFT